MNNLFKILIAIVFIGVVGTGVAAYFVLKKATNIEKLDFTSDQGLTEKITIANEWLTQLEKEHKFNGAVLLIKNDSVVLKNTYGYTDYTATKKLTNNSSFRLASLSKQFTAAGIMLLKEQGKLNFNDSITKYLPSLPYHNVTIRNLLHHTSGIPDVYMKYPKKYKKDVGNVLTIAKVVTLLSEEANKLNFRPNEKFVYSNTGYVLLAAIIEAVSNRSFEDFMQTELFNKLGMQNTRVWNLVSKDSTFVNKTDSFENILDERLPLKPTKIDGVAGDGAVFSSINDMVIWNTFWYQNNLISENTLKEAFTTSTLNDNSLHTYGFGWIILNPTAHWHNGSWLGARTIIIRNTELKNCLVILDNSASLNIDRMAEELVKVLKES